MDMETGECKCCEKLADEIKRLQKENADLALLVGISLEGHEHKTALQKQVARLESELSSVTRERDQAVEACQKRNDRIDELNEQLAACQKECSALRSDAERYRWLRDTPSWKAVGITGAARDQWDRLIDAARLSTDADLKEQTT